MRHLIVVLGLTLHVLKQVLSHELKQVLSHESHGACFFFPRQLLPRESERPSPRGQGWHNQISGPAL